MTNGERMEAKLDWCVTALKYLLSQQQAEPRDELEDWMDDEDEPSVIETVESDWVAPVHAKRPAKKPACPHNQQVLVDGRLSCAKCGFIFGSTGLVHNSVGPSGQIQNDPNPPAWALERSPGASSKNPGGPLVPY